jgi:DNA-binding NtrC family response regulator
LATILVIDDDDVVRDFLVEAIEQAGHEVVSANGGIAGIGKFTQSHPDMVLTDIVMPDRDGLEVIAEIRSADPGARIVAMSGGGFRANAVSCFDAATKLGAMAVLQKPFKLAQLIDVVDSCLASRPDGA